MNLENYYLDITKVFLLESEDKRKYIQGIYRDMLHYNEDNLQKSAVSIFNTLVQSKYLLSIRESKIDLIIDGKSDQS